MPPPPLDPDAEKLLDLMSRLGLPPIPSQSPAEARQAEARALAVSPPPRPAVGEVTEIGAPVRARLYRPPGAGERAMPALVYFHGGGWVVGSLDTHDHICRFLCRHAGIAVLSVDYPLAPEAPFPAAPEAARAAYAHAVEQAGTLGFDPARIGVGGDSAGANLAAGLALPGGAGALPVPRVQLLFYPALDLTGGHFAPENARPGDPFSAEAMRWYLAHYLAGADPTDPRASPHFAESVAGAAPAYVMTAGNDVLAPDGAAYAERLEAAGVPLRHRRWPGQVHGFLRSPHLLPTAWSALIDAAEYLHAELAGRPAA